MVKLGSALNKLRRAGLKVNAKKSFFAQKELEHLGHLVRTKHVTPLSKKAQAMLNVALPKTKKEIQSFVGVVNHYRDAWIRRSHMLTPLTKLAGKTTKWEWKQEHTDAFDAIKRVVHQGAS